MTGSMEVAAAVCFQCGGGVTATQASCAYCGMPVLPELVGAAPVPAPSLQDPLPAMPGLTLGTATPERRIGRKPLLISLAAVAALVLVATGFVVVSRLVADTPKSTVEDYFAALSDGDAAAALKLVARSTEIDTSRYTLLTDAGLADPDARPRDVEVCEASAAGGMYGEGTSTVTVTYRAGGTAVEHRILVTEVPDGDGYLLRAPFVQLSPEKTMGRAVTVNGVAVPPTDATDELVAFPGAYKATAVGTALFAEATATAVPAGGSLRYEAVLDFGEPRLAPGAEQRIESSVQSVIDRCAASTEPRPSGCPFQTYVYGSDVSVRWSVTTYPTISVRTSSASLFGDGDQVSISDDGSGSMHWTATYTDFSGKQQTESGDTSLRIYGTARASGSAVQVDLN